VGGSSKGYVKNNPVKNKNKNRSVLLINCLVGEGAKGYLLHVEQNQVKTRPISNRFQDCGTVLSN
jgi:hypothetical protein